MNKPTDYRLAFSVCRENFFRNKSILQLAFHRVNLWSNSNLWVSHIMRNVIPLKQRQAKNKEVQFIFAHKQSTHRAVACRVPNKVFWVHSNPVILNQKLDRSEIQQVTAVNLDFPFDDFVLHSVTSWVICCCKHVVDERFEVLLWNHQCLSSTVKNRVCLILQCELELLTTKVNCLECNWPEKISLTSKVRL